jgi:DNA-directed RNA polymerase subunit beta'
VIDPVEGAVIVAMNDEINEDLAQGDSALGVQRVRIRSVLTCESRRGVCIKCYGRNLATGKAVDIGECGRRHRRRKVSASPARSSRVRTFHIGGTARLEESSKHEARMDGTIKYVDLNVVKNRRGEITAMNRNGAVTIIDERGREVARHQIVYGAHIHVTNGQRVQEDQLLATWDPFHLRHLDRGRRHGEYQGLEEGVTVEEEVDEVTGQSRVVVKDSPDEKRPARVSEVRTGNKVLKTYQMARPART